MSHLILVDDDAKFRDVMAKLLAGWGLEVRTFATGEEALQALEQQPADLLVCDIFMKPMSGMEVLKVVNEKHPKLPVIMLTAYGTVDSALECLRMGAFDYLSKPFRIQELVEAIERGLAWDPGHADDAEAPEIPYLLGTIVGASRSMRDACTLIERVAPTDATVLFRGERGVGKQFVGRTIHNRSSRHAGPFVVADCSGKTPEQQVVELFGAIAGAIPGQTEETPGLILQAHGGTLWLNEVGALPPQVQERLFRLFKEQVMIPVGMKEPVSVSVRVLAATAMDMEQAVSRGAFRADLYARFAPISVDIKPLRERREDILPLVWHICRMVLGEGAPLPAIEPGARGLLMHYAWPGNVHELELVVRQALQAGAKDCISSTSLPENIIRSLSGVTLATATARGDESGRAKSLKAFLLSKETELVNSTKTTGAQKPGRKP